MAETLDEYLAETAGQGGWQRPPNNITWPPGAVTGEARIVIGADTPPELDNVVIGITAAILFYVVDQGTGLERGYFFIANSNDNAEFSNPSLQYGEVQYPVPGDPDSATSANVKTNQVNIMMDNLVPLARFFNIHISNIGGLFLQDGARFGSIDSTFGTSDVDVAEVSQDVTGGIFRMSTDALFEIPTDARATINLEGTDRINVAGACLRILNGGFSIVESGGEINVDNGAQILFDSGATLSADAGANVAFARQNCSVYRSAALAAFVTAVHTVIPWDAELWDTASMHDNAVNPSRIALSKSVKYSIKGMINFATNVNGSRIAMLRANAGGNPANGTLIGEWTYEAPETAGHLGCAPFDIEYLATGGDYIELFGYQNSGGNLAITPGSTRTFIQVREMID